MRDKRIVAEHRGGKLTAENHHKLMKWAVFCFERVLRYYGSELEEPLLYAMKIAKDWQEGKCSTDEAMKAARKVHAFAKTLDSKAKQMIIRSVGHGVATAHAADHSIGAALYALKALKLLGISYEKEKDLQIQKLYKLDLPKDLIDFIIELMETKGKSFGLWQTLLNI
ncbi:putative immunity protein [Pseudothermotoga elfii]